MKHVGNMSSAMRFHVLTKGITRKGNTAVRAYTYLYHTAKGLAGATDITDITAPL